MHVSSTRFDVTDTETARIDDFREYFFYSSEYCSECFTRLRDIGDEVEVRTDVFIHRINKFYERTETAVAERVGGDAPSERYGITFCRTCGAESGTRWRGDRTLEELKEPMTNILTATIEATPYSISGKEFARQVKRLKTGPDARDRQGRDLQILAVAWARAVEPEQSARQRTAQPS